MLTRVPTAFVPNLGQWEHPARFVARVGGAGVFLEEGGFTLTVAERGEKCRDAGPEGPFPRSEERRVGKECRL